MSRNLIRCDCAAAIVAIATLNGVSYSRTDYAASVTLSGGVCYFYSAA